MLQRTEIRFLFEQIRSTYGKGPAGDDAEAAWADALRALDLDSLRKAWATWRADQTRPPTPAGLIAIHRAIRPEQAKIERGTCEPCLREGGVYHVPGGTFRPPEPACIGPNDQSGFPEPMCGWHASTYAKAEYLKNHPDGFSATGDQPNTDRRHVDQLRSIIEAATKHLGPKKGRRGRSTPTHIEALRPAVVPLPPVETLDDIPF